MSKEYSEALECLEEISGIELSHIEYDQDEDFSGDWVYETREEYDGTIEENYSKAYNTIKQALTTKSKKEQAWDYLVKHFNIKCDINSMPSGEVWARFVNIQAKEDEGEWDCTASANLVNYEEDFDLLKEMSENGR